MTASIHRKPTLRQLQAGLVLLLHLRRDLWLARRTDITTIHDIERVTWSTSLEVRIDFAKLSAEFPQLAQLSPTAPMLLPLLTRKRVLLTRFRMTDHREENVSMMTWDHSRDLVEHMLLGIAKQTLRDNHLLTGGLDPLIADALSRFGGDVDEVEFGLSVLNKWAADESQPRRHDQVSALVDDPTMSLILGELSEGFLMMAPVSLRNDGSADVYIEADSAIEEGALPIPVGASPHFQFEIRLPAGVLFRSRPELRSGASGPLVELAEGRLDRGDTVTPFEPKPVTPWAEVHGALLAGYAPGEARNSWWQLRLWDEARRVSLSGVPRSVIRLVARLPFEPMWRVPVSVRNAPFLPARVRMIAWLTFAMFAAGAAARVAQVSPFQGAPSPLLVAFASAYAILLLQSTDVPAREMVSQRPRTWLVAITLLTFFGAADLAVRFSWSIPPLDRIGIGPRALIWAGLTVASFFLARFVDVQSRRVW
jgi:hypothetical protein